ncbi:MAG: hypothetical protein HQK76_17245 [Desulfobacterales bacterium]|nr:hypothetical protein [Desulfobacterales bacterium]
MKTFILHLCFLSIIVFYPFCIWGTESIVPKQDQISDAEALLALANIEAGLGHASKCYKIYDKIMESTENREELSLKIANQMNMWGDFHRIEAIYRAYLNNHPDDILTYFKIADVLNSSQRYEEAEGIYLMILLKENDNEKAILKFALVQLSQKKMDTALLIVNKLISDLEHKQHNNTQSLEEINQTIRLGLKLKAEILYYMKQDKEALAVYTKLEPFQPDETNDLILMGKIYERINQKEKSRDKFTMAYQMSPKNPAAHYYSIGEKSAASNEFVKKLMDDSSIKPMILFQWAQVYIANGFYKIAVQLYEKALSIDPECFPVRLGLAEILGIDHQYERSLDNFQKLSQEFPKNSKISVSLARVLGWSGQYQKSIALYKEILKHNDIDPVPRKEMARTAIWGKDIDRAMKFYESFWTVPIDKDLLLSLNAFTDEIKNQKLKKIYQYIQEENKKNSIFSGYETFLNQLNELKPDISTESFQKLEYIAIDLFPKYKIQKASYLESQAKWQAYNNRFIKAMDIYKELIDFQPGNQESIFDYAQIQCALGLCDQETKTYTKLLDIDPLHSLANIALEEKKINNHVSINGVYSFWKEKGRGDLSQISHNQTDLSIDIPLWCRYHLYITGHHWIEKTELAKDNYKAYGHTIGIMGVINPYIKSDLSWTKKYYEQSEFGIKDTGKANILFKLKDIMKLGLGFERTDELYNDFSLRKGIQSDQWWIDASLPINRRLEVTGKAKAILYNDDNKGEHYTLSGGYQFSDHPKIFKVIISGEYRDTNNENIFHYKNKTLTDITHPYWTPHDYTGTAITFKWYHDISKFLFCGSELHYYDILLSFGTNSEHNSSVAIEGAWHYEFYKRWMLSLKGMIHNSREWDSVGLWGNISYHF